MSTNRKSLEEWARQLRRTHATIFESVIALGNQLIEARDDVGHGSFLRLFKKQRNAIPNAVQFSLRSAEVYMTIARSLGAYSQHAATFPNSLRALLVLCKLEPLALQTAIEQHQIHPPMTEADAKTLLPQSPPTKPQWSLVSFEEALDALLNKAIENFPGSHPRLIEIMLRRTEDLKDSNQPELREAVAIARDELEIHDAEPGGFRIFETAEEASTHPGSPTVIASCPSTYPPWYKHLTTAVDGRTPLKRQQVERRLDDIEKGTLPTRKTERTHCAVKLAIKNLPRTSPLGRRWR